MKGEHTLSSLKIEPFKIQAIEDCTLPDILPISFVQFSLRIFESILVRERIEAADHGELRRACIRVKKLIRSLTCFIILLTTQRRKE